MKRGYPFMSGNLNYGYSYDYTPKSATGGGSGGGGESGGGGARGPQGPQGPPGPPGVVIDGTFGVILNKRPPSMT